MSRDFKKAILANKIESLIIDDLGTYDTQDLEDLIICLVNNHICTSSDSIKNLVISLEELASYKEA